VLCLGGLDNHHEERWTVVFGDDLDEQSAFKYVAVFVEEVQDQVTLVNDVVRALFVEFLHQFVVRVGEGAGDQVGNLASVNFVYLVPKSLDGCLVH
jgi:hypothetical protein